MSAHEAARARRIARGVVLALLAALGILVTAWQLGPSPGLPRASLALLLLVPLLLPLRGLLAGNRRTYAWATLCVIPYFVLGTTEAVASPGTRGWASACLAVALALFAALIAYLRVSRPRAATARTAG